MDDIYEKLYLEMIGTDSYIKLIEEVVYLPKEYKGTRWATLDFKRGRSWNYDKDATSFLRAYFTELEIYLMYKGEL